MPRRSSRSRKREQDDLAGGLFLLIIVIGWQIYKAVGAWLDENPWARPLIIIIAATFVLGFIAFLITYWRMRVEEARRRLIATRKWHDLTPSEFERYVAEIFRAKGYRADVTGRTSDGGIDLVLSGDAEQAIVQCKRYAPDRKVGVKSMREFSAVLDRHRAAHGYFVTTSSFTSEARRWAKSEPITLIDERQLLGLMREVRFGPYAEPPPKPPLFFTAWQWLVLALLGTGVIAVAGLLVGILTRG